VGSKNSKAAGKSASAAFDSAEKHLEVARDAGARGGGVAAQTAAAEPFKSGFVALVGRPNVGKSTLVNACLGERVAIESPVAQTTRKRMRAVITNDTSQIILVDTPGLHKPQDALGKELNRSALAELNDVDVVALLIDATKPVGRGDAWVAKHVAATHGTKLLVLTKADLATPEMMAAQLEAASELLEVDDTLVVSAREGFNVDAFLARVRQALPEGPAWFPADVRCDATDEELVAEFVREKVLLFTREEVPHSVGVLTRDIEWRNEDTCAIRCEIFVERESQKGILVGRGGSMIKRIGAAARKDIERLFDARVWLDLEVRVKREWRRDVNVIRQLGYESSE
jgi:GTP-binding protein Era